MRGRLIAASALGVLAARPGASAAQAPAPARERPNVVVFVGDDLGWRDTGAYGNTAIHTPNIDRLAQSGLRVEYAFGTSPQCSPSRISMLTGKYPHSTGAEDLHMPLPASERILPSYLQGRGYFTGHMAKTHYGPNGERQFRRYSPETAEAFPSFLNSAGTRPFFLWVGFHEPHRPYRRGAVSDPHPPAGVVVPPYLVDTPETRADLALYYDAIARMDAAIGRMLAELDRRNLRDHTVIVFLSDNGPAVPPREGNPVRLGDAHPAHLLLATGHPRRPTYDRGLVSTVDLAPTILDLTGAAPPRKAGRLTAAQQRLFEAPRARAEWYVTTTPIGSPACRSPPRFRRCATWMCRRRVGAGDDPDPAEATGVSHCGAAAAQRRRSARF